MGRRGIIFIRSQNVYNDGLVLDDVAYIDAPTNQRMQRSQVFSHDVLLNITGASIGRCCFVPDEFPAISINMSASFAYPTQLAQMPCISQPSSHHRSVKGM